MRFHAALAALAAVAAVACSEGTAPVLPAQRVSLDVDALRDRIGANETFPIYWEVFNPCNGELVIVSGDAHSSWSITYDENGDARYRSHFNFQGVGGVSSGGTRYRAINVSNTQQTFGPQPPYSYMSGQTFHLVAQGDEPDFRFHSVFHVSIDENYQQRILVDHYTAECSGANPAERVTEAAMGHANLTQGGQLRTISFVAIRHGDGRVTGEWELNNRANDTRLHGAVTCLTVIGNRAWIGGITEQSSNPTTIEGRGVSWRVVDNGEGANDPPDALSLTFTNLNPGIPELRCRNAPPYVVMPIEGGNIQVR